MMHFGFISIYVRYFNTFSFLFISLLLLSCGGEETASSDDQEREDSTEVINLKGYFASKIRSYDTVWSLDSVYTDTLVFLEYIDNYDYPLAILRTFILDTESVVCLDPIEDVNPGSVILLEWRIGEFTEAGEGDGNESSYYDEELIRYEVLEATQSLEEFLSVFLDDLCSPKSDLSQYVHHEILFGTANNPGAYCMFGYQDEPERSDRFYFQDGVVSDKLPKGDFCEGYEGVQNGFYYSLLAADKVPKFSFVSPDEMDFVYQDFPIPKKFDNCGLVEIVEIDDEFHYQYIYLIEIDFTWYIFAQDFCDCSV